MLAELVRVTEFERSVMARAHSLELSLEQSLHDCVTLLTERVAAARPLAAVPDDSVVASLKLLGQARRMLDALGAELAGQLSTRSDRITGEPLAWRLGDKSAPIAVARLTDIDVAEARDWCTAGEAISERSSLVGEFLPDLYPQVAAMMRVDALGPRSARVIVQALYEVSHRATREELDGLEALLLEHSEHLSRRELERACRYVIDHFDPDGAEPREDKLRQQSGVQVIRGNDGLVTWIVKMHPEAAGFLTTAVDARTAPSRQPTFVAETLLDADDRSLGRPPGQRRLDALVSIARESLAHDNGKITGTSVTMSVTITLEALLTGLGVAQMDGIDEPISAKTARRLACDAQLIPVVLGGGSEPLDLGQAQRLFSEPQRRALAARDGGCVWPNCQAPPGWCEVAHLAAWARGGPTDLANGARMCPFHHRRFDHDGWGFEWHGTELYLVPPAAVDPSRGRLRARGARGARGAA